MSPNPLQNKLNTCHKIRSKSLKTHCQLLLFSSVFKNKVWNHSVTQKTFAKYLPHAVACSERWEHSREKNEWLLPYYTRGMEVLSGSWVKVSSKQYPNSFNPLIEHLRGKWLKLHIQRMYILVPLCLYKGIISKRSYYGILVSKTSSGLQISTSTVAISIITYINWVLCARKHVK